MNCEICGIEIKGEPYKTKIDNSVMATCKECSKYGKVQSKPQPPKKKAPKRNTNNIQRQNQNRPYSRRTKEEEFEIVEDYAKIIRHKREMKGLTQKQMGEKLYEKESVLNKIENGKMVPDIKLAHKIEKLLNISIIEKSETDEKEFHDPSQFREATIGDIAKIKRK
ncbi:MAG: TIGR00270 family protein [Methanosphaera sp. rholeuAM270]|nr:MAG: TIGR00270 family protein [Methanosphaera sp. rholeuAM270]